MKNLRTPEQKLIINIVLILVIIFILGVIYKVGADLFDNYNNRMLQEKKGIIELYQHKIDSIQQVNIFYEYRLTRVEQEKDSLQKLKKQIEYIYDEKVNIVYDASASDHAKWLDSVIAELENHK